MIRTIGVCFLSAFSALAFGQTLAPAPAAVKPAHPAKLRPAKPLKAAPPLAIPPGAVKTPEGAYRFTDSKGKAWVYRETPFGVSRVPDKPAASATPGSVETPFGKTTNSPVPLATAAPRPAGDPTEQVTAVAKGDTVEFHKPTPFGVTSWRKNRNDLTADEQKIWQREQAKGTH